MTRKQRTFCEEFLKTRNGTEAAKAAGYAHAEIAAVKVRKNPQVQKFLAAADERALAVAAFKKADVLQRLWQMGNLPHEQTKGSVSGQVDALKLLSQLAGWMADGREVDPANRTASLATLDSLIDSSTVNAVGDGIDAGLEQAAKGEAVN